MSKNFIINFILFIYFLLRLFSQCPSCLLISIFFLGYSLILPIQKLPPLSTCFCLFISGSTMRWDLLRMRTCSEYTWPAALQACLIGAYKYNQTQSIPFQLRGRIYTTWKINNKLETPNMEVRIRLSFFYNFPLWAKTHNSTINL